MSKPSRLTWEDKNLILCLREYGTPVKEIAKVYNVTPGYIYHLTAADVDRRYKTTENQRADIIKRRNAGETLKSIAESLGITPSQVCRIANKLYYVRRSNI